MAWTKLIDLAYTDEEMMDSSFPASCCTITPNKPKGPTYPYGLMISLTEKELKKMKADVPEIGDYIDLRAFATVTSVSEYDNADGQTCRIELQIEKIAIEDENDEDMRA